MELNGIVLSQQGVYIMSDSEEPVFTSLEYIHGLHDGLHLAKDCLKQAIKKNESDKAPLDSEQLFLEITYLLERTEEKKTVLIEAFLEIPL